MDEYTKNKIHNIVDELYEENAHKLQTYASNLSYNTNLKQKKLLLTKKKIIIENDPLCLPEKIIETISVNDNLFENLDIKKRTIMLYFKKEGSNFSYIDDYEFSVFVILIKKLIKKNNLLNFNNVDFIVKDNNYPTFLECDRTADPEIGTYNFERRMNVYANPIIFTGQSVHSNKFFSIPICGKNIYIKKISNKLKKFVKFPVLYLPYSNKNGKISVDTEDKLQLLDGMVVDYKFIQSLYSDFVSTKYSISQKVSLFIDCILEIDKTPLYYDCT